MRAKTGFFYCLFSLSALFGQAGTAQSQEKSELLISAKYGVNGLTAVNNRGGQGYWLASSSESGILKVTPNKAVKTLVSGNYAGIDSVRLNNEDLIASFNEELDKVELIYGNTQYPLAKPGFNLDGLCLFRDKQNHVFLYLVDGYGGVDVRWVYEGSQRQFIDIKVSTLPTAPGIEVCAVDNSGQTLYLLEEELGLWQYPAVMETAPFRHLLLHSETPVEYQGVTVSGNALFVSELEKISYYTLEGEEEGKPEAKHALKLQRSWYVGKEREPEGLAVLQGEDSAQLAYIDDSSAAVYALAFKPENPTEVAAKAAHASYPEVAAIAETQPMDRRGDTADDPAIWVHQSRPKRSVILGTNKRFGLMVYNLEGELLQSLPVGDVNNVDLRQNNLLSGTTLDIAVASNRSDNSLHLFTIDKKGRVSEAGKVPTGLDDVYGLCLYRESSESLYAFINDKDGRVQQYRISGGKPLQGELVATIKLPSQPEGCVADDREKQFFIGEEDKGVWRYGFTISGLIDEKSGKMIAKVGDVLVDDVEGMGLYQKGDERYLVVSSQGDNSYAVFQADSPYAHVGSFRVGLNSAQGVDGTAETDGLAVSSAFFTQDYAEGMLVIQDGFNLMPAQPQNFKLVPWENVSKILEKSNIN